MSICKRSEEAVGRLLSRLKKTEQLALGRATDDDNLRNQMLSMFKEIEHEIRGMDDLIPQVKILEEDIVRQFLELEQEIDDGIFRGHAESNQILAKLKLVDERIESVKQNISSTKLEVKLRRKDRPKLDSRILISQPDQTSSSMWNLNIDDALINCKVTSSLRTSYENLSSARMKLCLLSLSIFPENSVIKRTPMIYWWIGEGWVSKTKSKTAEEVGDNTFRELIKQGLIRPTYDRKLPVMHSCTVHPWIRRMLISVAKETEFFSFDSVGNPCSDHHRIFFPSGDLINIVKEGMVLTVFNLYEKDLEFKADWLNRLKKVTVLQLGRWQSSPKHHIEVKSDEPLRALGGQKHLKYLSLRGISGITSLPRSITELVSLEILDLRACHNLEKLPSDISMLRNLTHLDISECYLLESIPKGIEELHALQVLKGFVIAKAGRTPCKISDLTRLRCLRKLSIFIGSKAVTNAEQQEFERIKDIASLRNLTISWQGVSSTPTLPASGTKSLAFPPELLKLDLRSIPEETVPMWLNPNKLKALRKLYIRGGKLQSLRGEENAKWNVESLRLKYLKSLTNGEDQLKEMFPELICLEKVECQGDDILWSRYH